jgi:plastocyanin
MRRFAILFAAPALMIAMAACGDDHGAGHGDMPMEAGQMPMGTDMPMDDMPMGTDMPMVDMPMGDMPMGPEEGHGGHSANSPVPDGARTVEMEARSFTFSPATLSATVGEPIGIALTATDIEHDLVIDEFDAHVYAAGGRTATGGFTATEAGTFTFSCSIPGHREAGMEGTLEVASG